MIDYNKLIEIIEKSDLTAADKGEVISLLKEHQVLSQKGKVLNSENQRSNTNELLIKILRLLQVAELLDKFF